MKSASRDARHHCGGREDRRRHAKGHGAREELLEDVCERRGAEQGGGAQPREPLDCGELAGDDGQTQCGDGPR